jgi:membrane protease YdiL (CAAX protease family)
MPGVLLGLALVIVTIFLKGKIYSLLDGVSAEEFNYLILCLVLAVAGEIIFRGFLQLRFIGWADQNRGWLLASLAHFLFCLPFIWLTSGGDLLLFRVPAAYQLLQSILLGWIMRRSGNVLAGGLYQAAHYWMGIL